MLYEWIRLFKYDGANMSDLSIDNQDKSVSIDSALTTDDYFYLAQYYPLNNFYAYIDSPNAEAANIVLEFWDGKDWRECVDVLDGTKSAGASFAKPGVIQFEPLRQYNWNRVAETDKNNAPTELQSIYLYDCYWLRFRFTQDLSAGTSFKILSYAFTTSEKLKEIDVEIDTFFDAFSATKTNWNDEILTSSRMVLADLKRLGLAVNQGQILRFDDVSLATDYKTLALIYMNLGTSYKERKDEIRGLYQSQLNVKGFTFDDNGNGKVDRSEIDGKYFVGYR